MRRNVLLWQLDGKLPNRALMRIAAHRRKAGDYTVLRQGGNERAIAPRLDDPEWDAVYASCIFERSRPLAAAVRRQWPHTVCGGSGLAPATTLETIGVPSEGELDYSDYPRYTASIGYSQRGCRLRCPFCIVPAAEGKVRATDTIAGIWRGEPWPRHITLLDNDFFGQPRWRERVDELNNGNYAVCLTQGINVRALNDETAAATASLDARDTRFRERRIYTAFDNAADATRIVQGIELLLKHGIRGRHILVYMLIGYWDGETQKDREQRLALLRGMRTLPYPMPFRRTRELVGFQRWVIGGYDRGGISWDEWRRAGYQPRNLRRGEHAEPARLAFDGEDRNRSA